MDRAGLHEERTTCDDQEHELERGDEREEHCGALPRLDGELGLETGGVIHERTGSPAARSFLPDPLPRAAEPLGERDLGPPAELLRRP